MSTNKIYMHRWLLVIASVLGTQCLCVLQIKAISCTSRQWPESTKCLGAILIGIKYVLEDLGEFPNEWVAPGNSCLCTLIDITQRIFSQLTYYELIITITRSNNIKFSQLIAKVSVDKKKMNAISLIVSKLYIFDGLGLQVGHVLFWWHCPAFYWSHFIAYCCFHFPAALASNFQSTFCGSYLFWWLLPRINGKPLVSLLFVLPQRTESQLQLRIAISEAESGFSAPHPYILETKAQATTPLVIFDFECHARPAVNWI